MKVILKDVVLLGNSSNNTVTQITMKFLNADKIISHK